GPDRARPRPARELPADRGRAGAAGRRRVIFLNGKLLDPAEARIDPADRGFLLGDGLFETLRAYRGRPFRLAAHLARLRAGAEVLGIPVPMTDAAIADAVS